MERSDRADEERMAEEMAALRQRPKGRGDATSAMAVSAVRSRTLADGFSRFGESENNRTAALGEKQGHAIDRDLNDLSAGFHGNLVA